MELSNDCIFLTNTRYLSFAITITNIIEEKLGMILLVLNSMKLMHLL